MVSLRSSAPKICTLLWLKERPLSSGPPVLSHALVSLIGLCVPPGFENVGMQCVEDPNNALRYSTHVWPDDVFFLRVR